MYVLNTAIVYCIYCIFLCLSFCFLLSMRQINAYIYIYIIPIILYHIPNFDHCYCSAAKLCFATAIGAAVLVVGYIRVAVWLQTAYRQTFRIRTTLLQAVLCQEIGWFDTHDAGELGSRLSESVTAVLYLYHCHVYI